MILYKTPYRIPLAGGGTDLDFYYKKRGGFLISATISEYMYTYIAPRPFDTRSLIQTTDVQFVNNNYEIENKIYRETLKYFKIKDKLHIGNFSSLPTGTGLGSSSSVIVGLIKIISKFKKIRINNSQIIKLAYKIEREILGLEGGWQDQIMATLGGFRKISINKSGKIKSKKISISNKTLNKFQNTLLLVFTKGTRDSSKIIRSQRIDGTQILKKYDLIKNLANSFESLIKRKKFISIGKLFHEHWQIKRKLSSMMTNNYLDNLYLNLMKHRNFTGGKIIGAGGGGFFLMSTKSKKESIKYLKKNKFLFANLIFEHSGSTLING